MSEFLKQLAADRAALLTAKTTGIFNQPAPATPAGPKQPPKRAKAAPKMGAALSAVASTFTRKVTNIRLNEDGIAAGMEQLKALPAPGESLHCIMGGQYHGFDVIPIVQRMSGRPIRSLTIATLGFSKRNTQQLAAMIDTGAITGRIDLLCSEYFAKSDPDIYTAARSAVAQFPHGGRLEMTRNHAKIILADCGRGHRYVVESSANLRSCVALEQFQINNDAGLFRFHRRWITAMLRKPDQ